MPRCAILLLALLATTLAACASGSTRAGSEYAFRVNELVAVTPHGIAEVHAAALGAVQDDFQWVVETSTLDAFAGRITARGASDKLRRVRLERLGDTATEVRILIGDTPFGDESRSRSLMSRIEERLGG